MKPKYLTYNEQRAAIVNQLGFRYWGDTGGFSAHKDGTSFAYVINRFTVIKYRNNKIRKIWLTFTDDRRDDLKGMIIGARKIADREGYIINEHFEFERGNV